MVILLILASLSILGTVIPQGQSTLDYIRIYGHRWAKVILFLGLNDMYHSFWFRALLLLFSLNLIFCSLERLPGVLRSLRRKRLLSLDEIKRFQNYMVAKKEGLERLKKAFGDPVLSENGSYLFEKGGLAPLGPYITHLGILVILVGGLIGSFFGIRGVINIPEGEARSYIFVSKGDRFVKHQLPFVIRCRSFKVEFYSGTRVPKEYRSDLEILSLNGTLIKKGTIRVNHPLKVMGYTIYQASYGRTSTGSYVVDVYGRNGRMVKELRLKEGEKVKFAPGREIKVAYFNPNLQGFGEAAHVIYYENGIPKDAFWLFLRFPDFDRRKGRDYYFVLKDVESKFYTGLEVSKSPGVNLVWLGSIIMSLGIFISFFMSHKKVWAVDDGRKLHVAGTSSKNLEGFNNELRRLLEG